MSKAVFVSGTDTGIGKTQISVGLLQAAQRLRLDAVGMKPVASGCSLTSVGLRNDDALQLQQASAAPTPPYELVNPVALLPPIAPHLAARAAGRAIDMESLLAAYRRLSAGRAISIVEGVGGWAVPLSDQLMQADLVRAFELPVLLVVGVRLGAISHALLSARAIRADGVPLIGWIANRIDPELPAADAAIGAISERIGVPLLAEIAHAPDGPRQIHHDAFEQALSQVLDRLGCRPGPDN